MKSDCFALVELAERSRQYALQNEKTGFESLDQGFGEQGRSFMKAKRKNEDMNQPQGKLTRIPDFLPPPGELLPREDTIKITVAVDSKTLKFFKGYAQKSGLKYQRIIREVLKGYARKYG